MRARRGGREASLRRPRGFQRFISFASGCSNPSILGRAFGAFCSIAGKISHSVVAFQRPHPDSAFRRRLRFVRSTVRRPSSESPLRVSEGFQARGTADALSSDQVPGAVRSRAGSRRGRRRRLRFARNDGRRLRFVLPTVRCPSRESPLRVSEGFEARGTADALSSDQVPGAVRRRAGSRRGRRRRLAVLARDAGLFGNRGFAGPRGGDARLAGSVRRAAHLRRDDERRGAGARLAPRERTALSDGDPAPRRPGPDRRDRRAGPDRGRSLHPHARALSARRIQLRGAFAVRAGAPARPMSTASTRFSMRTPTPCRRNS